MIRAERFLVDAGAPVAIVTSEADSMNVVVTNVSDDPVLLGGEANVDADDLDTDGYELPAGSSASFQVSSGDDLYALGTDGTADQEIHTLRSSAV